jgi:hypothetical protein
MPLPTHVAKPCRDRKRHDPIPTAEDALPPVEATAANIEAIRALGLNAWLDWPPAVDTDEAVR